MSDNRYYYEPYRNRTEQEIEEFRRRICSIYGVPYDYLWQDKGEYTVENNLKIKNNKIYNGG